MILSADATPSQTARLLREGAHAYPDETAVGRRISRRARRAAGASGEIAMGKADPAQARILVVDDEPANVRLLERMLAEAGYRHVKSTTDSRQVIALYGELQPDLILLDLMMPHLDGIAVIQQLHDSRRRLPADPGAHGRRDQRREEARPRGRRQGLPDEAVRPPRGHAADSQPPGHAPPLPRSRPPQPLARADHRRAYAAPGAEREGRDDGLLCSRAWRTSSTTRSRS